MMNEPAFWAITDKSREQAAKKKRTVGQDFMTVHEEALTAALQQLPPEEVIGFNERFWDLHFRAYRWDLWGAAYWAHGGCSDDGFIDFRACLISLGKEQFSRILKDPDALADILDGKDVPYMQSEGFQYVASKVYKKLTGRDIPQSESSSPRPEPQGEKFDFDDEEIMAEHYPKLVAKLPEMGD